MYYHYLNLYRQMLIDEITKKVIELRKFHVHKNDSKRELASWGWAK